MAHNINHNLSVPIYKQPKFDIISVGKPRQFNLPSINTPLSWLNSSLTIRKNIKTIIPWAKSIILTGLIYARQKSTLTKNPKYLVISDYASIKDYHKVFKFKLNNLIKILKDLNANLPAQLKYKIFADSFPIYEKGYATTNLPGYIGKNGLFLSAFGSKFLIGGIITNIDYINLKQIFAAKKDLFLYNDYKNTNFAQNNKPPINLCKTCNVCQINCPMQALKKPGLIIEKCISYLTVEKKGSIPVFLQKHMKNLLFGCDICQNTCIYNKIYQITLTNAQLNRRFGHIIPNVLYFRKAAHMSASGFHKYFKGTPVIRMSFKKFKHRIQTYIKLNNLK